MLLFVMHFLVPGCSDQGSMACWLSSLLLCEAFCYMHCQKFFCWVKCYLVLWMIWRDKIFIRDAWVCWMYKYGLSLMKCLLLHHFIVIQWFYICFLVFIYISLYQKQMQFRPVCEEGFLPHTYLLLGLQPNHLHMHRWFITHQFKLIGQIVRLTWYQSLSLHSNLTACLFSQIYQAHVRRLYMRQMLGF